jgi:hypothetical protein
VIVFNRPADNLEIRSVIVVHGKEMGYPESLFPVLVNGMKNPNEPELLHVDIQALIGNRKGRNRAIVV